MQKQNQTKLFAFKLAEKQEKNEQWKVREGVAAAGCSGPLEDEYDNYRAQGGYWNLPDKGYYC